MSHHEGCYEGAMAYAAYCGHTELVDMLIKYGATDFNLALCEAAAGGHLHIIDKMIEHGANDYDGAIENSIYEKRIDVLRKMLPHCSSIQAKLHLVGQYGDMNMLNIFLERGAKVNFLLFEYAIRSKNLDIVNYCLRFLKPTEECLTVAILSKNMDLVLLLLEHGALVTQTVLFYANRCTEEVSAILREKKTKL